MRKCVRANISISLKRNITRSDFYLYIVLRFLYIEFWLEHMEFIELRGIVCVLYCIFNTAVLFIAHTCLCTIAISISTAHIRHKNERFEVFVVVVVRVNERTKAKY